MLLVILGVVWMVVIPATVVLLAWAADLRRRRRVLVADPLPVILLGDDLRTAIPACARRMAADRTARRRRCPAPAATSGAR